MLTIIVLGSRLIPVLWIRTGFNADPDPEFKVKADTQPVPDPDPGR